MDRLGLNRDQAMRLIEEHVTDRITKFHLLETEAVMRALARRLGEDEDEWGITGLLHDIDWDKTKSNPKDHLTLAPAMLKAAGASDFLVESVVSHGYGHDNCGAPAGKERSTRIEHALAAAETLTGLVVASALVQPDKKLASVRPESLKKKFNSKSFAANCDREIIKECGRLGIDLDEFLTIGLDAIKSLADDIGL